MSSLYDPGLTLFLDSSVIINLNATGCAGKILSALPLVPLVPNMVAEELAHGAASKGYLDADRLRGLVNQKIARIVTLSEEARDEFRKLRDPARRAAIGDGEAAVIACAASAPGSWAAIDERRARRVCQEEYPGIKLASATDILSHENVTGTLSNAEMAKAVFGALTAGNMQVQSDHYEWVLSWIHPEDIDKCISIPGRIRKEYKSKKQKN